MKPMLAKEANLEKISFPLIVQPKLDGIRACVVDGKLLSRTLKPIPNAEIRETLERPEFEGLDGELIVGKATAADCYRRTSSFVMSESKTGEPWAFDVFDKWNEPGPFTVRYAAAEAVCERQGWTSTPVFIVKGRAVETMEALEEAESDYLAYGLEGAILRDPAGSYKFGRSGATGPLLKLKRYIDFEAEVIGVYEEMHNGNEAVTNALGRTERSTAKAGKIGKGTLGGLVLRAINGPAEGVEFRCGTGFDAADRSALWSESPVGRIAKVKSFPIGVKDKPRHPVWLGWRDMKIDG